MALSAHCTGSYPCRYICPRFIVPLLPSFLGAPAALISWCPSLPYTQACFLLLLFFIFSRIQVDMKFNINFFFNISVSKSHVICGNEGRNKKEEYKSKSLDLGWELVLRRLRHRNQSLRKRNGKKPF